MDLAVTDAFGYHALQLGLPEVEALRANRMPHRWVAVSYTHLDVYKRQAQPRRGGHIDVRTHTTGLRDQLESRQLLQQGAREVGSFADQHQHVGVAQAHRELADALHRVGEDLGVVGLQQAGTRQLADGVLIVVEDDDVCLLYTSRCV